MIPSADADADAIAATAADAYAAYAADAYGEVEANAALIAAWNTRPSPASEGSGEAVREVAEKFLAYTKWVACLNWRATHKNTQEFLDELYTLTEEAQKYSTDLLNTMDAAPPASIEGRTAVSWTKEEIKQMTAVLMHRLHGDGRDRQEVETVCLLAETSIMNRESCGVVMEENEELKAKLSSLAPADSARVKALEDVRKLIEAAFIELGRQGGNMTAPHLTSPVRTAWEHHRAVLKQLEAALAASNKGERT